MRKNELELDFIEELVDETLEHCKCNTPGCNSKRFMKKGKTVDYIIEYESTGDHETNIFIRVDLELQEAMIKTIEPVVFNGFCESNMDFATTLRMVIK